MHDVPDVVQVCPVSEVTVYPVTGEPPLFAGAVHETVAEELFAVALTLVGAPGTVDGVAAFDAADAVPVPMTLVATTVKAYEEPLVKPVTAHEVVPLVVQMKLPGEDVTVYPVMGDPPLEAGAVQETTDWPLAFEVATTLTGAPGTVGMVTGLEGAEAAPAPSRS